MADKKAKAAAAAAAPTSCCGGGGEKAKATGNVADTPAPKRQRVPRNLIMGQGGQRGQEGMYTPAVLAEINDIITHALDEDVGTGDVTSLSTIGAVGTASCPCSCDDILCCPTRTSHDYCRNH